MAIESVIRHFKIHPTIRQLLKYLVSNGTLQSDAPIFELNMDRPQYLEYPEKPQAPPYHNVPLSKIPKEEIDTATQNTKEYIKLLEQYSKKQQEVRTENRRREAEYEEACWNEIYENNSISDEEREHELVKWARTKAWDHGHSAGMSEVAIYFDDFIEAYNIHLKLKNTNARNSS